MKVGEFVRKLLEQDQDREVICVKDGEGNGFSPLGGLSLGSYKPTTQWSGESGLEMLTGKDIENGYTEEDLLIPGENGVVAALFLHPMN